MTSAPAVMFIRSIELSKNRKREGISTFPEILQIIGNRFHIIADDTQHISKAVPLRP